MTQKTQKNQVAVLETANGEHRLVIRSAPSQTEVKAFVKEHNRRYQQGVPGGPSGIDALQIVSAAYFPTENDIGDPDQATPIKLPKTVLLQEKAD